MTLLNGRYTSDEPTITSQDSKPARAIRSRADAASPSDRQRHGLQESPLVLTDAVIDDGTVGHSMVFTYTPAALSPTRRTDPKFRGAGRGRTARTGRDRAETERPLPAARHAGTSRHRACGDRHGVVGCAGTSHRTSLVRLLGSVEKPVPAYGAIGYDGVDGSARTGEDWAKRGFVGVKAKIGYPTVREDVAVIRAIRKAVGENVAIMVDYNQSLTPAEAVQRMRVLDDEGLTWVEEPTLAHDYVGHAMVTPRRARRSSAVRTGGDRSTCSTRSTRRHPTT